MSSKQKNLLSIVVALSLAAVLVLGMGLDLFGWAYEPAGKHQSDTEMMATGTVIRVIDGDTLEAQIGSTTESVRLIGIDTPEITWPNDENNLEEPKEECLAFAARDYLRQQVEEQSVSLVGDSRQPAYDQYDRLLAYLYVDEELINQKLLEEGLAKELTVGDGYEMQDDFRAADATARAQAIGLWSACE